MFLSSETGGTRSCVLFWPGFMQPGFGQEFTQKMVCAYTLRAVFVLVSSSLVSVESVSIV